MAEVLNRLDGVRKTGHPSRWIAKCPAHQDRSPSLSITEADNGAVLIHCFASCGAADVVNAVGLELSDLFPSDEGMKSRRYDRKPRVDYRALCILMKHELTVLEVAAAHLAEGKALSEDDRTTIERVQHSLDQLRHV